MPPDLFSTIDSALMFQGMGDPLQMLRDIARSVWTRRIPMPADKWAEEYRVVGQFSNEPGRWSFDNFPYLRGPLQSASDPNVREVIVQAASQTGKTEMMLTMPLWVIHQNPAPTLLVWPDRDSVRRNMQGRVVPAIEECKEVLALVGADTLKNKRKAKRGESGHGQGDLTTYDIKTKSCTVMARWAGSQMQLRSAPARFVFPDEVSSYPPHAIGELRQRSTTYADESLMFATGVPGLVDGPMDQLFKAGDQRRWWVPCIHCGVYQVLVWDQVRWDNFETADANEAAATCHIVCRQCGAVIRDHERRAMVKRGMWAARDQRVIATPEGPQLKWIDAPRPPATIHSYQISALYSTKLPLANLVREWIGNRREMTPDFACGRLGESFSLSAKASTLDELRALQREEGKEGAYALRKIPRGCRGVIVTVDVQNDLLYWLAIGVAPDAEADPQDKIGRGYGRERYWLIDYGPLPCPNETDLAAAKPLLSRVWPLADDHELRLAAGPDHALNPAGMRAARMFIDSGHRNDEVMRFAMAANMGRSPQRVYPLKGFSPTGGKPVGEQVITKQLDKMADGSPIPGGIRYMRVHTDGVKTVLAGRLRSAPPTDGSPHPLAGAPEHVRRRLIVLPYGNIDDLLSQLISEELIQVRDRRGRRRWTWALREGRTDNHYADLWAYALAGAWISAVRTWTVGEGTAGAWFGVVNSAGDAWRRLAGAGVVSGGDGAGGKVPGRSAGQSGPAPRSQRQQGGAPTGPGGRTIMRDRRR